MLNVFRILGDFSHLVSILILIQSITQSHSTIGVSFKTQLLYVVVFVTRYLDLLFRFISLYNTLMKIFFISSSVYILHLMKNKFKSSDTARLDTFKIEYLVGGSFVFALFTTHGYSFTEVLWCFSLWLESVAILPQLFMLQRTGQARNLTSHYIFALGLYRTLYIPNWIYRYFNEGRIDWVSLLAGLLQTAIYSDFFWIYYQKIVKGNPGVLPV
jgi:ER lumen protein retaining receptor